MGQGSSPCPFLYFFVKNIVIRRNKFKIAIFLLFIYYINVGGNMFVNNQFTIYSEHTLFVVDENQTPQRCLNEYSDLEVIRVLFPNGETRDYPIKQSI